MFSNYLKIFLRNFNRNKLFSFINVFGLSVGIASCLIIYLWIQKELSYDKFHKNAHRIYRVERELFRDNRFSQWPITGAKYKQALVDDIPEIENAVRFYRREFSLKDYRNIAHRQQLFAVDNSIFEIFDFGLTEGDEKSALLRPKTVVLNREKALKYFGTDNVIGKSLEFEWEGNLEKFKVTGILNNVPENSHIKFDMLISMSSFLEENFTEWRSNYLYTYVLLHENVSQQKFQYQLKSFVENRLEPFYGDLTLGDVNIHDVLKLKLFPITDIHLYPRVNWEIEAGGNILTVYIFSSIALLILIIACLNFINLSTARANKRAKEVSLRKTIGANKGQLRIQFIQESILLTLLAFTLSIAIIYLALPAFNILFKQNLSINLILALVKLIILLAAVLSVGFLSGLYPAYFLTRFEPIRIIKHLTSSGKGKAGFRRNMVVIQFVISIVLFIGMFTIYKQMKYIQDTSLGYNKENVVILPVRSRNVVKNYDAFQTDLLRESQIISVSASADIPSDKIYGDTNYRYMVESDKPYSMKNIFADYDFINTYKMEIIAGRSFSKDFKTDTTLTIMLNQSAVYKLGWSENEAVGKILTHRYTKKSKVVGVVKNFHFKSLHNEIEPLVILLSKDYISYISVRIKIEGVDNTLNKIKQKWQGMFPNDQFEYGFLDERLNELYEKEQNMNNIFLLFSILSILIACLGLLGLSTFMVEDRKKEIGIRKVLGATEFNLIKILSNEFLKWVLLANIIAWPLGWWVMNSWLQNFAYKTEIAWWIFCSAGIIALVIALITVSLQSIKAAITNPVESLRYE
jgi:putative ABC transport system permease protein